MRALKRGMAWGLVMTLILASCGRESGTTPGEALPAPPVASRGTMVALGDSLTAGYGLNEDEAWPALLERRLASEGKPWKVVNAGISGETSSGTLSRVDWIIRQLKPDIVILAIGGNDGLRGLDVSLLQANITSIVRKLQNNGAVVVLAGMRMVRNLGPDYTSKFDAVYPAVARDTGAILVPFLLEGVATVPALNLPDGIHPNAAGHSLVVETLYPFVLKALEGRR